VHAESLSGHKQSYHQVMTVTVVSGGSCDSGDNNDSGNNSDSIDSSESGISSDICDSIVTMLIADNTDTYDIIANNYDIGGAG